MNQSYREPIESDFFVSVTENDTISELEDECSLEPVVEVMEEPVIEPVVEVMEEPVIEPVVKVAEEPVVKVAEEPVVKVAEEPVVKVAEESTEKNQNIREPVYIPSVEIIPKKTVAFSETIEISTKTPTENIETIAIELDKYVKALDPALSKFAYYLTPQEFIIIKNFVNDSNTIVISQIKECVQTIMSEDVIQLHDIPNFILSILQIFKSNFTTIKDISVTNIIKYTLDSLMEYNVLVFKGDKTISKSLIETSFKLLQTSIVKNKSKKFFSSLFSCFR